MGKIKKGILGGFSGKVGNVVGGSWKGIDWMRSEPQVYVNPRTPKQQAQRSKFGTCIEFARGIIPVINMGLKSEAVKRSAFNYLVSKCMTDWWDNVNNKIDYTAVQISSGSLPPESITSVSTFLGANSLTVTAEWVCQHPESVDNYSVGCVYVPSLNTWYWSDLEGTNAREDNVQSVTMPLTFVPDELVFYLYFVDENLVSFSPSTSMLYEL